MSTMNTSKVQYPLRDKRKQKSRSALIESAERLFRKKGFDNTSMEEVAKDAGLHVQTLYNHFPNKLELQIATQQVHLDEFKKLISARDTSALVFWRRWVVSSARMVERGDDAGFREARQALFSISDVPRTSILIELEYEKTLAEGIAEDMNVSVSNDRRPMLIACMLWGGNRQVVREWVADPQGGLETSVVAVVDEVSRMVGHLFGHE